jgi:hypothetical protein
MCHININYIVASVTYNKKKCIYIIKPNIKILKKKIEGLAKPKGMT